MSRALEDGPEKGLTMADCTSPRLIIPYLHAHDVDGIILELSEALHREGRIPDVLPFYHAAVNREYLCGTIVEPGWALPHAPVRGLDKPCFALGRTKAPIAWTNRRARVRVVFLIAAPETKPEAYMRFIYGAARLNKDAQLCGQLLEGASVAEILEVLSRIRVPEDSSAA